MAVAARRNRSPHPRLFNSSIQRATEYADPTWLSEHSIAVLLSAVLIDLWMDDPRLSGTLGYTIIVLDDRMTKDADKDRRHPSASEAGRPVVGDRC